MNKTKKHRLIELDWPQFGTTTPPPPPDARELQNRIDATRARMEKKNLTHLIVYGDREHFANLAYLTGFDPRFEEAVLIIGQKDTPLLLVGNECAGYLTVSSLYNAKKLRHERFQSLSLLSQPREDSRPIKEIFADEGIKKNSRVGCVGWKYFSKDEHPTGNQAIEIPAYLVDTLREMTGHDKVVNATDIFMNPEDGLRTYCSPSEIAYFEYSGILASEGIKKMIFGLKEGMIDYDVVKLAELNGEPLGCHLTMVTGDNRDRGLSSPIGAQIRRGDPFATNICYWGSNVCRAGWIAESAKDLPAAAQDYVENFAGPYIEAVNDWFGLLKIGTTGDQLNRAITEKLPFDKFGIFLNAGHLIHLDE
ncbi:MAG: hypothetical protein KAI63_08635, partial [Planctomycetes bacterium]|nr:hypothetical protein [Planctomycetota bacterium]